MSLYGQQIGRQPFRPGQWSRYQDHSHKTYVQNNFYGSVFGGGNSGCANNSSCCGDGGGDKAFKWMMGLGIGTTLLGGILGAFGIGRDKEVDNGGGDKEPAEVKDRSDLNTKTKKETPKTEKQEMLDPTGTFGARKFTNTETLSVPYEVQKGDNPYEVIKGKYTNSDGTPISHSDALAIARSVFEGKGLKAGTIQLDKTITLGGKTFTYNAAGKVTPGEVKDVKLSYYESSGAKQISKDEWAPVVDEEVSTERYGTEQEAKAVAEKGLEAKLKAQKEKK